MTEEVVRAYYANLASLNLEGWKQTLAEDATIYDPVGKPPFQPQHDSEKFFALLNKFYEKFEVKVDNIFFGADQAAVKWTMTVTAKNKRSTVVEGIGIFHINPQGKIQQMRSYWDETGMKAKLMEEND